MKEIIVSLAGLLVAGIVGMGAWWMFRAMSSAVTSVVVIEPEPGIRCAKVVTGDGAAIDCWETR
jgi:hypothetical protein